MINEDLSTEEEANEDSAKGNMCTDGTKNVTVSETEQKRQIKKKVDGVIEKVFRDKKLLSFCSALSVIKLYYSMQPVYQNFQRLLEKVRTDIRLSQDYLLDNSDNLGEVFRFVDGNLDLLLEGIIFDLRRILNRVTFSSYRLNKHTKIVDGKLEILFKVLDKADELDKEGNTSYPAIYDYSREIYSGLQDISAIPNDCVNVIREYYFGRCKYLSKNVEN